LPARPESMNAPGGACHVTRWPNGWAWVRSVLDAKKVGVLMKLLGRLAETLRQHLPDGP
jgi:hypothetical protein